MTEPKCTCRWNEGKEPGSDGYVNTHHVECPGFVRRSYPYEVNIILTAKETNDSA